MKTIPIFLILFAVPGTKAFCQEDEYLLKDLKGHKAAVTSAAFSPDGNYLVSGGEDNQLIIWSVASLEPAFRYSDNYYPPRSILITRVNTVFYGSGPDIKLVNLDNNTLAVFKGNTTHIWSVDYAPERQLIAAGSYDYKIKVWDVATQEIEFMLEGHEKSTLPVAFSPDEKYLVSGSLDRSVKIWNAQSGELIRSEERHTDNIYDIAFHPSGKYFATCSRDKTVRLWDFESGEVVKSYIGHDKGILDIAFTPDGNHIISASIDGTIRLWETKTGKMVYTFTRHEGTVNSIAVNDSGNLLASGGADEKLFLWKLDHKIFVEYAFGDEYEAEKDVAGLFGPKIKGEAKPDYEKRVSDAAIKEKEIIEKYYKMYIDNLNLQTLK